MKRLLRVLWDGLTARDELGRLVALVADLPGDERRAVGRELWRRNRRSWKLWAGVALLGGLALVGAWLGSVLPLPRAMAPGLRTLGPGVTGLLGTAVGMMLFVLLARPIAGRNLRAIFAERGLCPTCGYDLRATPGRCPECGTPTSPRPAQADVAQAAPGG